MSGVVIGRGRQQKSPAHLVTSRAKNLKRVNEVLLFLRWLVGVRLLDDAGGRTSLEGHAMRANLRKPEPKVHGAKCLTIAHLQLLSL